MKITKEMMIGLLPYAALALVLVVVILASLNVMFYWDDILMYGL